MRIVIGFVVIFVLGVGMFFLSQNRSSSLAPKTTQSSQTGSMKFGTPKKAAHYESNTPEHGAIVAGVPINVVIDFNFDLAMSSKITIEKDGKDYATGETIIDDGKLAMRRNMEASSPDGMYTVKYDACWADGSCHDGQFQFVVDRSQESSFEDMTGKAEVTVDLQNIAFTPAMVKVSKGTKVTWVNQDNTEHTVNTDSHPAHTYYPDQNSRTLSNGDSYSTLFDKPGIYFYHCTPHADSMKAQILVVE